MLFKYPLSDSQYARFQHDNNDAQIQALGEKAGVRIMDERLVGGIETMDFSGRCSGWMSLVPCDSSKKAYWPEETPMSRFDHYECWVKVTSKPWWLPWAVLDWGFRKALE